MSTLARISAACVIGLLACGEMACNTVPQPYLRQSQLRARQLYGQNQSLAMEREQASQTAQALAGESQQLAQQNQALRSDLEIANQRLANLNSERAQLQDRYVSLLNKTKQSPLSSETTRRFEDLARRYPDFDFDPQTGVSKFHSDVFFDLGSADVKTTAHPILKEFASILGEGDAKRLNILVVGHTDDTPIKRSTTKSKHPTNLHLSTNRANSVALLLAKFGITENRVGAAGYGMHQPVVPNTDDKARQRNRRVEIFVLAPDAVVAGWDRPTVH